MASSHVVLLNSPHVLRLLFTSVVMLVLGIDRHYCSHVVLLTFVIQSHGPPIMSCHSPDTRERQTEAQGRRKLMERET